MATRVTLTGGPYQARSIIANAQRCVNMYPEANPPNSEAPVPVTHYLTPGLRLLGTSPLPSYVRCVYAASNGDLYAVVGPNVYYVSNTYKFTFLGSIADSRIPVIMADNGLCIVLIDGTANGYTIDLTTKSFGTISATNFYGGTHVVYLDTYFVINRAGTTQFFISKSNVTSAILIAGTGFDPLDIAAKTGSSDNLVALISVHRELWLIGRLTSEPWINTGKADFTFEALPGAFVEHGCIAPYSVSKHNVNGYWLSQDAQGQCIVVKSDGSSVSRISTHAIETAFQDYVKTSDAIGFIYQQQGHVFYVLIFPDADKTWQLELATGQWNELASIDLNGTLRRHRSNCSCFAYGVNIVGDWQNGNLYALDPKVYTDNGTIIPRIRSFPHLIKNGNRVTYVKFIADMSVGDILTDPSAIYPTSNDFNADFNSDFGPDDRQNIARISLKWSDTRGKTYGNAVLQNMGQPGEYLTSIQWNRLGMARDRVFELSWAVNGNVALNGAFIEVVEHSS